MPLVRQISLDSEILTTKIDAMKTVRFLSTMLLFSAMCFVQSACHDKDDPDYVEKEPIGWIRFSQDNFELGWEAEMIQLVVEVNNVPLFAEIQWVYPWITSCKLVASEQGGKSRKDTFLITLEENDTYARRSGNVDFYVGTEENRRVKESIIISQRAKP